MIGVGNVGLDVARMLARTADELLSTDIPQHVHEVLADSAVTDVHMFARRGPAQAKFTPVELRELDHSPNVQVVVGARGHGVRRRVRRRRCPRSKSLRMVVDVLSDWAMRDPEPGPHRRIHIHFLENPVEILGADGAVVGLRTERQELTGDGNVRGTGEFTDWDVQAVYRAVGLPLRGDRGPAVRHPAIRAAERRRPGARPRRRRRCPGIYATGWVKRGPVGLIGHTKSDAAETIANLLADAPDLPPAPQRDRDRGRRPAGREGPAGHRLRRLGPAGRARAGRRSCRTAGRG